MDEIIDGNHGWPVTTGRITTQHVKVTMAGNQGFQAVTGANARQGQARITGNLYNIELPGLQAGGLDVEFRR